MEHKHIYDEQGRQLCCHQEEKIYAKAGAGELLSAPARECCSTEDHGHDEHDHDHSDSGERGVLALFWPAILSGILLLGAIALDNYIKNSWFTGVIRVAWYVMAYLPVGVPVLKDALQSIRKGDVFSEFFLMGIATVGAFAIGEYPEGVAVMLFYAVGETFQSLAVKRAKGNIRALLDERPDEVTILDNLQPRAMKAREVGVGAVIQLKAGEKLALDGELLSASASFNTAALTGESKPDTKFKGEQVLAGMINLNQVSEVKVTAAYTDSKLSRILEMVQDATARKSPTELFIRKFARIYTPAVVFLALGICLLPRFFVNDYSFSEWLYKALVFLVISCPCALVISIPLGYFGGIGAASRHGILFKGSNFLDALAGIQHVVVDKTGTMTKGVFKVQEVLVLPEFDKNKMLAMVNALESKSTHPVATAIYEYAGEVNPAIQFSEVTEIPGHGLKGMIDGNELLAGNLKLLDKFGITYEQKLADQALTLIAFAYQRKFAGYLTIADELKEDAAITVSALQKLGIKLTMLSGDKTNVVNAVAEKLGIQQAYGDLLPEDKVEKVKAIRAQNETVAFAGDGVNDAPVVALSDVGMAMGGLGSDATIETADVVIQDDSPYKIPTAVKIGRKTKQIVWQNILLAFAVKAVVLILGAGGLATMWEAVFADVGVALLAILNAVRIQRMQFD